MHGWIVLVFFVSVDLPSPGLGRSLRGERAAKSSDDDEPSFWQVNQYVCPPALCPDLGGGNVVLDPSRSPLGGWTPFFEGDIVRKDRVQQYRRRRGKRSIARPIEKLWKYGIVPYEIDPRLNSVAKKLISQAINHYHEHTCIRFRQRQKRDTDYIKYIDQPGCWSYVGRQGGEQLVSLGLGCEHFGTVVHETGHALGFWHEQSRLDRDRYIQILEDNISPYTLQNFGKMKANETTSRGYAYDYNSIMHYGEKYFTKNGKVTIKIKKIGREKNMKIGQRKALSDLDLSQLRAMYFCNSKDKESRMCPKGWVFHDKSCYKFVRNDKSQFGKASKQCAVNGGHLVHIENEKEDKFIKQYLITHYPGNTEWRTGGFKVAGKFMWYDPVSKKKTAMNYNKWAPNHPGKHSSLGLFKYNGTPPRFVWRGMWAGSVSQLPKYTYNYICEKPKKLPCITSKSKGQDYRGSLDYTVQGVTCQRWSVQWPHSHTTFTGNRAMDSKNGLGYHNYCRNPNGKRQGPWCYTNLKSRSWQYCDLSICK